MTISKFPKIGNANEKWAKVRTVKSWNALTSPSIKVLLLNVSNAYSRTNSAEPDS